MTIRTYKTGLTLAGLLFLVLPAAAQIQFKGIQLSTLNGTVGAGYSDGYGNLSGSNHSLGLNGNAALNGFYFNPRFISFSVNPYYDESRANSNFRSVADSSGVAASTSLFSGSHFPGSISYGLDYNTSGEFTIPGQANVTTHGNDRTFSVNWGENLPNLPSVSVNYGQSNSQYSLFGSNSNGTNSNRQYGVHSNYVLAGFHMNGTYNHSQSTGELPAFLQLTAESSSATGDGYGFGVSHRLPLHGGGNFSFNHSTYSSSSMSSGSSNSSSSGGVNNINGELNLNPRNRWSVVMTADYSDNLAGLLNLTILSAGAPLQESFPGVGTQSLSLTALTSYSFPRNISMSGEVGRRMQSFKGENFVSTTAGGSLSTLYILFGSSISSSITATDTSTAAVAGSPATSALGLNAGTNFSRSVGVWETGASVNYTQNQQTLLISYLTSSFSYNGHVYRHLGKLRWTAYAGGGHSGFVQQAGSANSSESVGSSLGGRWLSGNGSYSRSKGLSVLTPTGLVTLPTVPILGSAVLFNGDSYSISAASSPRKNLTLSLSYAASKSNTLSSQVNSANQTKSIYGQFNYRFRQLAINGGYSQLIQGFSSSAGPPANVSSFYIGVNRWFNFF
jgi:hypothetical protein